MFCHVLIYVVLLLTLISYAVSRRRTSQRLAENDAHHLPPGSMGWPYIGETLQLYSQDPNTFFSTRQKRYGEIFKSHILGYPCAMLASPEAAKFVLITHANLFKPTYPKSKEQLIGPSALFFHQGDYHSRLRSLVKGSLYPQSVRRLVGPIESLARSALESWASQYGGVINTYSEMKKLSFEVGVLSIFGTLELHCKEQLRNYYMIVERGYNSFPTNIPGSRYRRARKARKGLSEIIKRIARERKEKKKNMDGDDDLQRNLMGNLLNYEDDEGKSLSDDEIADNVIGVLFAAQDTTASALTWTVKYLHDNPKLLEAVGDEHRRIYEENGNGSKQLTWSQTRNMPLTHKVILESLRMSSIISFTFREATTDIEYKGYRIPKGWKVMPLFRNIHHNSDFFKDPHKFDPTRFEGSIKPNTFMPFGSGAHACPGNELAKLQILILVHHLTSQYRYELVGCESGVQYGPFPVPSHGLPARFFKQDWTNYP